MNCVQVREDTSSLGMGWKGSQYLQRTERGRKLRLSDQWRQEKNQEKMASQEESREDPGRTLTLRASTIAKWRMAEPPSHSQSQGVIRCSPVHSLIPQLRNPSPRNVTRLVWGIMANSWEVCHWQPKFIEVGMKLLDFSTSLPLKIYMYIYFNQHISSSVFLMSTTLFQARCRSELGWLTQFHFSASFWMNNHQPTWKVHSPFSPQVPDHKLPFWTGHKLPTFGSYRFLR